MSISNYAELKILEHTTGKTAWTMPTNAYVKLHLGDPGEAATSNAAVEATLVHSRVADVAMEPDAAEAQAEDLRVVSPAALDVAASPGSPVCNLIYTVVGMVQAVVPVVCSRILFSA